MTSLKDAVEDLLNHRHLSVEQAADRHFAPGFRQRTNGHWDDRDTFVARIAQFREIVEHASITVLDELADGPRYAERHRIELQRRVHHAGELGGEQLEVAQVCRGHGERAASRELLDDRRA